jgi:hypothetical protein
MTALAPFDYDAVSCSNIGSTIFDFIFGPATPVCL